MGTRRLDPSRGIGPCCEPVQRCYRRRYAAGGRTHPCSVHPASEPGVLPAPARSPRRHRRHRRHHLGRRNQGHEDDLLHGGGTRGGAPLEAIDEVQIGIGAPVYKNTYRGASGTATTPSTGTATDGKWTVKVVIPRYTNPGTWDIGGVFVRDAGGGSLQYAIKNYTPTEGPTPQPWGATWPRTIHVASTPDIRAPHLTGFSAHPRAVDTRTSSRTIAVKASLADSQSGVAGVAVWIGASHVIYGRYYAQLKRISGTPRKGTWTGRITVPQWIGSGVQTWVFHLAAGDQLDNEAQVTYLDLAKRHLTSSFRVRSQRRQGRSGPEVLVLQQHPGRRAIRSRDRARDHETDRRLLRRGHSQRDLHQPARSQVQGRAATSHER